MSGESGREELVQIFALKTTTGQEVNVANLVWNRANLKKVPIYSVMIPDTLKGYIFIEAAGPHFVDSTVTGIKHARQRVQGTIKLSEIERYMVTKPVIEELNVGDIIEVVGGPLKGMRARITRVDKGKSEVTLELLESTVTLPITVHADYVRVVEKAKEEG